ncbi:hypothetical protein ACIRU3_24860 [Streptomyces sp. NPDC101151]|uniref:hypothetical protein n=1 Tax=Streptomyces sp. NPDC101151 TaxID=3366115 RepID=UPI00382EFFE8
MHSRPSAAFIAAVAIAAAVPVALAPAAHAAETGPDLVVSTLPGSAPEPGEMYEESVTITNKGTAAADGVVFRIRLTRGLEFPAPVAGCTYSTVEDQVRQALCTFDTVIEPGASVTAPVRFRALPDALMEAVEYGTGRTGEEPGEGFDDSYRRLTLTADNTADLAAVGDRVEARAGSTVTLEATLRNDGPGWIQNQDSDDHAALLVRIPAGTVAVDVPKDCEPFGIDGPTGPSAPGKPQYVCWPADHILEVGRTLTYTFVLRLKATAQDTEGEVKATSVYDIHPAYDHNSANDTARLIIDVPGADKPDPGTSGGGGTGGDGEDGGSTTGGDGNHPQGQVAGGTGTTGSTSGGSSTGDPTSGSGATGSSTGGSLAATGSAGTSLMAGAAAAAAGFGGLLIAAVRRRSPAKP